MKTLYLECNMGAAGDMLNAALLGVCPTPEQYFETMNHLGIEGLHISAVPCEKCGIAGLQMAVEIHGEEEEPDDVPLGCAAEHRHAPEHLEAHAHPHSHHDHDHDHDHSHEAHAHDHGHPEHAAHAHTHAHFTVKDIVSRIEALPVPEEVRRDACAVYGIIAKAESEAHGKELESVHFHEVGAIDAIADVVGACLLMHMIRPDRVVVSPIHVGSGQVKTDHGILPVPVPAVVNILKGVPTYCGEIRKELCTPTGAALLKYFADEFAYMPLMQTEKIGYGMGKREFAVANCLRAVLGTDAAPQGGPNGTAVELSCNLDDMTPEAIGAAEERLFAAGALDVFTTPISMKKNRPAVLLTCLCKTADADRFAALLFRETATIGVRRRDCSRYTLDRRLEPVTTPYGDVKVKYAEGYGVKKAKPEYEDVVRCAEAAGVPFETVYRETLKNL